MPRQPTQWLDPRFNYCAGDFKKIVDFGAASTRGGRRCMECRHRRGMHCGHPRLQCRFSLGTHADRMGCRNGWEEAR